MIKKSRSWLTRCEKIVLQSHSGVVQSWEGSVCSLGKSKSKTLVAYTCTTHRAKVYLDIQLQKGCAGLKSVYIPISRWTIAFNLLISEEPVYGDHKIKQLAKQTGIGSALLTS